MKHQATDAVKTFTRRALFIGAMQWGLLGVMISRLGWLQLSEGQRYKTLADKNRINIKLLPPLTRTDTGQAGKSAGDKHPEFPGDFDP